MKGDELVMKYKNVLIFIAGSSFICDLMIKVSNIKEILPILTIDLKFLFKIRMELFIRKTSPCGFLKQVRFSNLCKEKRRAKQTVNMPRQFSILGKMNSFPLRLESILVFLKNRMQDIRSKIGSKIHGKKLIIHWELKKVLPYVVIISIFISSSR